MISRFSILRTPDSSIPCKHIFFFYLLIFLSGWKTRWSKITVNNRRDHVLRLSFSTPVSPVVTNLVGCLYVFLPFLALPLGLPQGTGHGQNGRSEARRPNRRGWSKLNEIDPYSAIIKFSNNGFLFVGSSRLADQRSDRGRGAPCCPTSQRHRDCQSSAGFRAEKSRLWSGSPS